MKTPKALKILYVENDLVSQTVFQLVHEALGRKASEVELANDGNEALKLIEEKVYDIIFLDIGLPSPGGLELTELIRKSNTPNKTVPIVALTCHSGHTYNKQALECGMTGYMQKPITMSSYLEALENYLPKEKSKAA